MCFMNYLYELMNIQLTFVTRAVRLVDLITNMDITTFTNFSGLTCLISRLDVSVELQPCKLWLNKIHPTL